MTEQQITPEYEDDEVYEGPPDDVDRSKDGKQDEED